MEKRRVLAVVGATASGKSALSLALAARVSGEIVVCDSMQIYRQMSIGTAKPTERERALVPHHLVDAFDVRDACSAADYAILARRAIDDILARGKTPILVGGTGLYLDATLRPVGAPDAPDTGAIRARLLAEGETPDGRAALYARLCAVDPASAAKTHENNLRRVVRALEIYESTGTPKSEWDARSEALPCPYDARVFALTWQSRAALGERIDRRVDQMFEDGLVQEARALFDAHLLAPDTTAGQAIGYKELAGVFTGEITEADAREEIKRATRRYAKRQETWFRAHRSFYVLCADDASGAPRPTGELVAECLAHLEG